MDFFFFLLKEASPGCPGACGEGLPSPLPCSSPPSTGDWRHTGEREITSARQFWGWDGDGVTLSSPPGSAERGWEG